MTTIPASVKAQLDADWTGAGGAEPTFYLQEEDFRTPPPLGEDSVWIMSKSLDTDGSDVVNDTFVDEKHLLALIVNTADDADRLKELSDEVVRILNASRVGDITYQRMRGRNREVTQNRGIWVFQEVITYDLTQHMKSSAAAYGAGASGDFDVVGDFTVSGDSVLTGDLSVSGYDFEEAEMLGVANKVWIAGTWAEGNANTRITKAVSLANTNIDGTNMDRAWILNMPLLKNNLKLYTDGVKLVLEDADATDYVDRIFYMGAKTQGTLTFFSSDNTNRTAPGDYTYSFSAVDISSFDYVGIAVRCVHTDANDLDIGPPLFSVWYDT